MIVRTGVGAAWNYTMGPALLYTGRRSIDEIYRQRMPVVVVAEFIPLADLEKIELTRVYGFVMARGSTTDPEYAFYMSRRKATVLGVATIIADVGAGTRVVVDGVNERVYVDPDDETVKLYEELRRRGPGPMSPEKVAEFTRATLHGAVRGHDFTDTMSSAVVAAASQSLGRELTEEEKTKVRQTVAVEGPAVVAGAGAGAGHDHDHGAEGGAGKPGGRGARGGRRTRREGEAEGEGEGPAEGPDGTPAPAKPKSPDDPSCC